MTMHFNHPIVRSVYWNYHPDQNPYLKYTRQILLLASLGGFGTPKFAGTRLRGDSTRNPWRGWTLYYYAPQVMTPGRGIRYDQSNQLYRMFTISFMCNAGDLVGTLKRGTRL